MKKFIAQKSSVSSIDEVGGKGHQLQMLVKFKQNVPDFFVVTTTAFREYRATKTIPADVETTIESFFEKYQELSFRSSMVYEDGKGTSFAGLFDTILGVTKENWKVSLIQIFDSVQSKRVKTYLEQKKLEIDLEMAVVIQKLERVNKSGVVFSRSPVGTTSLVAIDSGFGLGEGVVSGHVDIDHYKYDRLGNLIESLLQNPNDVLNSKEREKIVESALQLEELFGHPVDVEWGIKGKDLFIFQARPISRDFKKLEYFVDTNLSESYPSVVSPFTAAFVKKAYENVFLESAIIIGARGEKLETLHFHYKKLISEVDNHLYYNLEHYYSVLRALPGGEKNISNWHKMIGGKFDLKNIPYHATAPSRIETVTSIFRLITMGINHKHIYSNLIKDLNDFKVGIEVELKSIKSSKELINYLDELIDRPLRFGLTVVNDVFIMIGLSLLSKHLKRRGLPETSIMEVLKTKSGVESVLPQEKLQKLSESLSPDFLKVLGKENLSSGLSPYDKIFVNLKRLGYSAEVSQLEEFLLLYGERSFEELKLESLPLMNSPKTFYDLLCWIKNAPENTRPERASTNIKIQGFMGFVHRFTLKTIEAREETRLFRGKFYNLIRQLILRLEVILKEEDSSWKDFHTADFFSITPKEWLSLTKKEAQTLMLARREWQTKKKNYPEVLNWVQDEAICDFQESLENKELSGQGVSEGRVEGTVLVLDNPEEAFNANFPDTILVTKNTDPAWVYIMAQSRGLISEKGSLLSHTAIIGRELGIPTIVGVRHATRLLKTGDRIVLDSKTGLVQKL